MALTTEDGLVSGLAGATTWPLFKRITSDPGSRQVFSTWRHVGQPTAPATPGSAATCDGTTAGAVPLATATGGNTWYIGAFAASMYSTTGVMAGAVWLWDRLAHVSALSGTVTTAQTAGVSLPARVSDKNTVMAFLEVHTATGATPQTVTFSYTNQSGTAGKTATVSLPANAAMGLLLPMPLASGDTGITSVETITLAGSTGTAGDIGVTLGRPLVPAAAPTDPSLSLPGWQSVVDAGTNPCLWLLSVSDLSSITTRQFHCAVRAFQA